MNPHFSLARRHARDLLAFIEASPTPWHTVRTLRELLQFEGFTELALSTPWAVTPEGRYFVAKDGALIAFVVGTASIAEAGYRIAGAHTDSPGLRVKPNAAIKSDGLVRLGLEVYGGAMIATFADRELSIAGRLHVRSSAGLVTQLVHVTGAVARVPTLAIHMNRGVNEEGLKFHRQNELMAVVSGADAELGWWDLLARDAEILPEAILSADLLLRDRTPGALWGSNEEFLASPQLDNLVSCHAIATALMAADAGPRTLVGAFFDHEEVGSQSEVGASGPLLDAVLERLSWVLADGREADLVARARSTFVSVDMAHAWNPNFPAAYEPEHKVMINEGVAVKVNVNQRYATDGEGIARVRLWAEAADVPLQIYAHRSELACGSTIGPLCATRLGIKTIDIGAPMWSMHSARESAGVMDPWYLTRLLSQVFQGA